MACHLEQRNNSEFSRLSNLVMTSVQAPRQEEMGRATQTPSVRPKVDLHREAAPALLAYAASSRRLVGVDRLLKTALILPQAQGRLEHHAH